MQTDLDRVASRNEARWSALNATNASRDGKVELLSGAWAAASARRAAEGVARLAAAPPARGEEPLYAEAPAAAPGDLDDVWDRLHTKADGTAVLKLRDELREIAASLAGDTALTRRRKAICSGALGVRARSGYVLKDGVEVCISCQHPGSPAKRETVSFEGDKLRLARTQRTPTRAKPSVGRVRPASAGALRNSMRVVGAFSVARGVLLVPSIDGIAGAEVHVDHAGADDRTAVLGDGPRPRGQVRGHHGRGDRPPVPRAAA